MGTMISMTIIRRAGAVVAAAAVVPVAALAASGCGGAAATAGGATNGLEHQMPTAVLQDAARAVAAAHSVQIVWTPPRGNGRLSRVDARIQGGSETLTVVDRGVPKATFTIIGQDAYVKINPAVLKMLGGPPLAKSPFGQWLKIPAARLHLPLQGISTASVAALLGRHGPLDPAVAQATLDGRKVVVVTDLRTGGKIYVANTGPAYPLRLDFMGPHPQRLDFSDYGANFHITAPRNAIPAR
jgi:hypothetical protein